MMQTQPQFSTQLITSIGCRRGRGVDNVACLFSHICNTTLGKGRRRMSGSGKGDVTMLSKQYKDGFFCFTLCWDDLGGDPPFATE